MRCVDESGGDGDGDEEATDLERWRRGGQQGEGGWGKRRRRKE